MDEERSWRVITEQRLALAEMLDGLTPLQWDAPSLCVGWRVRDVAAHVALAPQVPSAGAMLREVGRARGRFHRLNHDMAVDHARRPPDEIVRELRRYAGSRRLPVVTNYRNIVFDVLVHTQDIAIPSGIPAPVPVDAGTAAADRVWGMGWPFWAKRRLRGLRLRATDADWQAGHGAAVDGTITAILLLLTGRAAALPLLTGDGVAVVTARMTPKVLPAAS